MRAIFFADQKIKCNISFYAEFDNCNLQMHQDKKQNGMLNSLMSFKRFIFKICHSYLKSVRLRKIETAFSWHLTKSKIEVNIGTEVI